MNHGWVKLHRGLLDWEWYDDINTKVVFLHLLLVANHKDNQWRGISIKRGQRLTSIDKLSSEIGLSVSKIRTCLKKLISTNEIASKSHSQHTVFTVVNYDSYQGDDKQNDKPLANESQTNDKPLATNKNDKNDKTEKNDKNKDSSSLKNDGFEHWWNTYPKKVGKVTAEKSFKTKTKKMNDEDFMKFVDLISNDSGKRFKDTEKQFILSPTTYLNQERYNDE